MVGFIHGRAAIVLTLICIGVCVRFGQGRSVRVTLSRRRDGARVPTCGLICGGMVQSPVMRNWSFNYEAEEFDF